MGASLSTRQLLRIARRLSRYPDENVYDLIQKACLSQFLPRLARSALESELEEQGVVKPEVVVAEDSIEKNVTCTWFSERVSKQILIN